MNSSTSSGWYTKEVNNMNDVLIIAIIILIGLAVIFFIPQLLVRRAVSKVIKIFRKQNATSLQTAKTLEELRLAPKDYIMRMMSLRDYKPQALELLVNQKIVIMTEDDKFYLSEQSLAESPLGKKFRLRTY